MAVYFVQAGKFGPIKIGYAVDPNKRLGELQVGSPVPLELLATIPDGTLEDERALHRRFKRCKLRGEWFDPAPTLTQFIASLALADIRAANRAAVDESALHVLLGHVACDEWRSGLEIAKDARMIPRDCHHGLVVLSAMGYVTKRRRFHREREWKRTGA